MSRKIGIMTGVFDPIHWGHLGAAIEAGFQLGLERVLLSPTGQPPHKTPKTPIQDRFAMVEAAIRDVGSKVHLEASRIEMDEPGPHFTSLTLERLQAQMPDATLHLIVGSDAAHTLGSWKALDRILELAHLVVTERAGVVSKGLETASMSSGTALSTGQTVSAFLTKEAPGVGYDALPPGTKHVRWPGVLISSTEIRRRVQQGEPIEYLVPRSVAEHIDRHGLYR